MSYIGARVEMLDGSLQGTITAISAPNFWSILWDDGESGAVHPLDVRLLGGFHDIHDLKVSAEEWAAKSRSGEVCGILGCRNTPIVRCAHCQNMYCEEHKFVLTTPGHPQGAKSASV